MQAHGEIGPSGNLGLRVIRGGQLDWPGRPVTATDILEHGMPQRGLPPEVNRWRLSNKRNLWRGVRKIALCRGFRLARVSGQLWLKVLRGDGTTEELGLASLRVVTDAGVASIVDAFQNTFELENYDFHGFGTGTTAEAATQTALVTEETTQYATDNTRPTGTPSEPSANVYRSVATYSPDSGGTRAITEHGLFSQAATGGGTMLDRSLFAAVNLVAGSDSLQATYDFTVTSGG